MGQLKYVSLALAAVAVLSIVVGGIGFSNVAAERGVQVNVVDDKYAYLGLQEAEDTHRVGESSTLVEVSNQFTSELSLNVVLKSASDSVRLETSPNLTIQPGNSSDLDIACTDTGEQDVILEFAGSAAGSTVDATRRYTIDCEEPSNHQVGGPGSQTYITPDLEGVTFISFLGEGQVKIVGNATDVNIGLTYENGSKSTTQDLPVRFLRGTPGNSSEGNIVTVENVEGAICSVTIEEETFNNSMPMANESTGCNG